MDLKNFT